MERNHPIIMENDWLKLSALNTQLTVASIGRPRELEEVNEILAASVLWFIITMCCNCSYIFDKYNAVKK